MTIIIRVRLLGCCQVETHDLKKGGKQSTIEWDEILLINEQALSLFSLYALFALFLKSWAHGGVCCKG